MKSASNTSGTVVPKSSDDRSQPAEVGPPIRMPLGGYAVRHNAKPGIYGVSHASRSAAWTDAVANAATGTELYGIEDPEETASFGSWHVTLIAEGDEVSPMGSSPGISKLQTEAPRGLKPIGILWRIDPAAHEDIDAVSEAGGILITLSPGGFRRIAEMFPNRSMGEALSRLIKKAIYGEGGK